jgi:hypothetical protein
MPDSDEATKDGEIGSPVSGFFAASVKSDDSDTYRSQTSRQDPVWKTPLDDTMVAVICVRCGEQHSKAIRWFRDHTKLICNGCGCAILLQNEQLHASIEELDHAMRGLGRSLEDRQTTH